jgi:hypothetical protein
MTVDDGTTLDSRQPITGDPNSKITHASLTTSLLWWLTVSSLVIPLLDCSGDGAFALAVGNRSVVELKGNGDLKRIRLSSALPGGTTTVELIRVFKDESLPDGYVPVGADFDDSTDPQYSRGDLGCRTKNPAARWHFFTGNEYYLKWAGPSLAPPVTINTLPSEYPMSTPGAAALENFEQNWLFGPSPVLILPHTYLNESLLHRYLAWISASRRPSGAEEEQARLFGNGPATAGPPPAPAPARWDPSAPPDAIKFTCPVPVAASFQVTGLIRDGQWQDPSDLEAARSLLQSRFDLKIGMWDLVNNPTLRRTLLDPTPSPSAPKVEAVVPQGAAERAKRQVDSRMAARAEEKKARSAIARKLKPILEAGWRRESGTAASFSRPLTESVKRWWDTEPFPLVRLELSISKRHCEIGVFALLYNQVDVPAYTQEREAALRRIAAPDSCSLESSRAPSLWRVAGGWGDDVDWTERALRIAEMTPSWIDILDDLCVASRQAHASSNEEHPSNVGTVTVKISAETLGRPADG